MKRLIEDHQRPQVTVAPDVSIKTVVSGTESQELGATFVNYEYAAMLNGGEIVRATLHDPHYTMVNWLVGGPYLQDSRYYAPVSVITSIAWVGSDRLHTSKLSHAISGVAPYGPSSNSMDVEFIAVDHPSYWLSGGDGAGRCWTGNIKQVVEQVVQTYGGGDNGVTIEFRGETNDSKHNKWWQCRMSPKDFILSLLEWSTSLSEKQTKWFVYPDDNKIIIQEQASVEPKHRATYEWRGYGRDTPGGGDILEWEMIGDNALQIVSDKVCTHGMSAVSGAYYDTVIDKHKFAIGDASTPNKYNPRTNDETAYSNSEDEPQPNGEYAVGWTNVQPIPEHSAGDVGIRYDEYMDGAARGAYLSMSNMLMRCRFRVFGHHIWSGSEGLGADTINIVMQSAKGERHFLHGNWIVYGFHHIVSRNGWVTDLYCMRLDWNATARKVGI